MNSRLAKAAVQGVGLVHNHMPTSKTHFRIMLRRGLPWLMLLTAVAARAGLNVTNYSATNLIKVMAVGDSITDDCETVGAWRERLQPLLDSNNIPFTFIGREMSPVTSTFTKVHHEGYCGAVIAAPGVSTPEHLYTEAENYLEYIVPGAMKTNTPAIMLILIGANDIGRGRNPAYTATNDMPNLLDYIFSNAPAINVIISKITTLSNASLGYAAYATNVPIYNAALQAMVNQRQTNGQSLYLDDMFSQLNYSTMFMSDHLHPNALGLKAMAQEWYTRIQSILTGTNQVTVQLIHGGDYWTYNDTGTDLGTNWTQPGYDDSSWSSGVGRFGYGELPDATTVSYGDEATNKNITTYFRKTIVVPWNQYLTNLNFRLTQTAGAVVWLNGQEAYRTNLPTGPIAYTNLATTRLVENAEYIYYQTNIAATLQTGANLIAVEVHQNAVTNAVLGFDMELLGGAFVMPPPAVSAGFSNNSIVMNWPMTNGAAFTLYSAGQLTGAPWQPAGALLQTNNGQITVTITPGVGAGYFRLQLGQ
jgi:hypothetical protein